MKKFAAIAGCVFFNLALSAAAIPAETTNAVPALTAPALPEVGPSLLRVLGALAVVIGIFLGGVWLFRNWQRLARPLGRTPKLKVVETRSLGGRQALYVVGYESERFLIAASPAGVQLLSHLPAAETVESAATASPPSFAQTLTQVLRGK